MIGESIGNFRITARLGRGGMGEVYAAEHDAIQTRVAIKLLLPEISRSEEHVRRFFQEAIIVGRIKHAGTVKIFDSGFHKDHAYLMMELLEGETLATRIERDGAFAPAQIVEVARQMASVLDATHRAGIIHRDLKPDNVFLVPDHELAHGERVKILDFGISKLSGTIAKASPRTQGTMGTPQYMAPEQWGDSATVDWRADAYSLGCVCYEMTTGSPPFDAQNIAEAYGKHLNAVPTPPSKLGANVPPALESLVLRLLAKRPGDRASSMAMVVSELEDLVRVIDPAAKPTLPRHQRLATGPAIPITGPTLPTDPTVSLGKPASTTTLGSAASQIDVDVPPRRRRGIVMILGGAAVATAIVVFVAAKGSTTTTTSPMASPNPAPPTPIATPTPTPPPTPIATPTPPPTPIAIPDPMPAPVATPHIATTKHAHPKPATTTTTPTPTATPAPTPTPAPAPAGSNESSDPWGGRR